LLKFFHQAKIAIEKIRELLSETSLQGFPPKAARDRLFFVHEQYPKSGRKFFFMAVMVARNRREIFYFAPGLS
jgi:hypothetical protein